MVSGKLIPPPNNVDPQNMEALKANMHLYEPKHFLLPFLAHALGTLVGSWLCTKIAQGHQLKYALTVGIFFLAAGVANCVMLPAPTWFEVVDVVLAYIPMAWLGWKLAKPHN